MISILICSRTTEVSAGLKANIDVTIGVEYELIAIDNSDARYSIFEAYNIGIAQSKYPFVCMMHDDILYHTQNWGTLVLNHFNNQKTGLIGVAGTPYVPYMPGSWWGGKLVNINMLPADYPEGKHISHKNLHQKNEDSRVIILDGIWFCARKKIFDEISFDEVSYKGFHLYDADICMQAWQKGYSTYCVFDILVQHFSKGDVNKTWYENAVAFNDKWKPVLPAACIALKYSERCEAELKTLQEFVSIMISNGENPKNVYLDAFFRLIKFYRAWFYYKTYLHIYRYFIKSF